MNTNLKYLQDYMIKENIDVTYLDDPTSVAYFTNFESNPHERIVAYIITQNDDFLFVPTLEKSEASLQSHVEKIYSYTDGEDPWLIIANEISKLVHTIKNVSTDETTLTVNRFSELNKALLSTGNFTDSINYSDISSFIEEIRVVKSNEEIKKMKKSGELADRALEIGMESLKEGISEQEVAAIIEMEMKKSGVSAMSFPTIVLFGDHAASPHGSPGNRKLKKNELVLFDLGVIFDGYASDVTRTISFGEINEEEQKVYQVVLEAQKKAAEAVKPGIKAGQLDKIARKVITNAGYGEYFTHRLGHGIGKTAHEFPSIHGDNDTVLQPGMAFSIEPGIYIPNKVGVRIEDCVYVTAEGSKSFTTTDKELIKIKI